MEFVALGRFRKKPTKDTPKMMDEMYAALAAEGIKRVKIYWTLGRFDVAAIIEAPNERAMMKYAMMMGDVLQTETLVAVPREEAIKWLK